MTLSDPRIILLAKAPVAGQSKTRLCPPCTPEEAAQLAEASLRDTCAAMVAVASATPIAVLEGAPGPWLPPGVAVVAQRRGGLGDRLAGAFHDVGGPALLIGMDTPQVTPALLTRCLAALARPSVDAVLGLADDGGFWAIGFRRPIGGAFDGVSMSADDTGTQQMQRLVALGLRVGGLPALRDVDTIADAEVVAAQIPQSHFACTLARLESRAVVA
ncbi:MAG: glycosyltransferase [Actinobacteria bacterium]|nr:glycosyltransferase [Actinomycetota bacterium]